MHQATLFDYINVQNAVGRAVDQDTTPRYQILRSFLVLYFWDECGGTIEGVDKFMRTPNRELDGDTPIQVSVSDFTRIKKWIISKHHMKGKKVC